MTLHFVCPNGHKVTAPFAVDRCPLAKCAQPLRETGPNFGPLKNAKAKATTATGGRRA